MKKHKENVFAQKFHLLSSQESEEINWSSSESSDYENVSSNVGKVCNFSKKTSHKRKRKKSVHKNISNLDITVIDVTKEHKDDVKKIKSNVSVDTPVDDDAGSKSPILGSTQYFMPYKCTNISNSPIIGSKTSQHHSLDKTAKSPILVLKTASPKVSPHVRKKLFNFSSKATTDVNINDNLLVMNQNRCLDKRKSVKNEYDDNRNFNQNHYRNFGTKTIEDQLCIPINYNQKEDYSVRNGITSYSTKSLDQELPIINKTFIVKEELFVKSLEQPKQLKIDIRDLSEDVKTEEIVIEETPESKMDDSMVMLKTSSVDLAKKVKSYFDNQFSSEDPSQQTISEVTTPKNSSKTSEDIEIINIPTQILTNKNSNESIKELDTFADTDKKEKKIRYKKDGLAFRLNNLLKKQTASISLWQHERFLAANSNFVIPKGEFLAFRICKINFKYGCHLLETMDFNDDNYLILINNCHFNDNILTDSIIKIYEPYTKVDFNQNCKLIINVTKFECVTINK